MITDQAGMQRIDAESCRRLLRTHSLHVGRVAFTDGDGHPVVLPFNYRFDGSAVLLRTGDGPLLAAVRDGRPLAFEVDEVDPAWQDGWSVLVQGHATEITDPGDLERVQRLPLHPWAPGRKTHWLRLLTDRISGRRIL